MATLNYKGKPIEVLTGADVRDVMQLLLTDVGAFANWRSQKDAQDKNRDEWLREFFTWTKGKLTSEGGIVPASLVSLLSLKGSPAALPAPTTPTTPTTPIVVKSPHRQAPLPTVQILHPNCAVSIAGTDRSHQVTIELTGAYSGSTGLCEVTYGTPYDHLPTVIGHQVGSDPRVDSWVVSYTTNGYRIDSASFGSGMIRFNTIVCPQTEEAFD